MSWKIKKKLREITGRERGTIYKDPGGKIRVCLVYPNTYYLGMSNLGMQTVYGLFNSLDECLCERAFLPDKDLLKAYKDGGCKLLSLESQTPLKDFDIVAFSVSFEEDYVNIPFLLELSGIPVFSNDRGAGFPAVIAAGAAVTLNPEPISDFIDAFFIGEGEESIAAITAVAGHYAAREKTKREFLEELSSVEGIYVPSFYGFSFEGCEVKEIKPLFGAPFPVKRARVKNIDATPVPQSVIITPDTEFSGTFLMEVERGCPRGCRFCAAGFMYLPPRWRDFKKVEECLVTGGGGLRKAGLVGAAISEYEGLTGLIERGLKEGIEITLSSLRLDVITPELLKLLKKSGYSTVTVAPEAGTERLRRVINKDIGDEMIIEAARSVHNEGYKRLKLYFMTGLPTETDEDAEAIANLSIRIKSVLKGAAIVLSINPFIPKPNTPFQWHPFEDAAVIERRHGIIKKILAKEGGFKVDAFAPAAAFFQAYIARADRRAGKAIALLAQGRKKALRNAEPDSAKATRRQRGKDELLPWDVIDYGFKKNYLWSEYQKGFEAKITPPCNVVVCTRCGVCGA